MAYFLQSLRLFIVIALICGLPLHGESVGTGGCAGGENPVVGILEEELGVPGCGAFTLGVGMKFKIFDKNHNEFYHVVVVVLCPNIYGKKFFKIGAKYRITCKGRIDGNARRYNEYVVVNKYIKENLPTYIAEKVVLLE